MEVEVGYKWRRCSRCGDPVVGSTNGTHVVTKDKKMLYVHKGCVRYGDWEYGTSKVKSEVVLTIMDGDGTIRPLKRKEGDLDNA